jgi:PAS domain-containing protein
MVEQLSNPHTLFLLVGGAALVGAVLTLAVYLLQRSFSRPVKSDKQRPPKVRVEDEAAFTLATIKSVVTELKTDQKALQEELAVAQRNAEETSRKFELIAREIEQGLIVFNPQGYISFSNPLVRKMLVIDTWSRRRYSEIFHEIPALSDLIRASLESGAEVRKTSIEIQLPDGKVRRIEASVLPTRDRAGAMESVTCIFWDVQSRTQ